jgi:hypothetical protein
VKVRLEAHDDDVLLTVRDTGIGISAEFLPHIFCARRVPRWLSRHRRTTPCRLRLPPRSTVWSATWNCPRSMVWS